MIFFPFLTLHVTYDALPTLLGNYGLTPSQHIEMVVANPDSAVDRIDVYYGSRAPTELQNFVGFVKYAHLTSTIAYRWDYDVIVAVGRNALSGVILDIPVSMFPWTAVCFSVDATPTIFQSPLLQIPCQPQHTYVRRCFQCSIRKHVCAVLPGMRCASCDASNLGCHPQEGEEYARAEYFYDRMAATAFAFCAPYQHLIQSVKVKLRCEKAPRMPARSRAELLGFMTTVPFAGYCPEAEQIILRMCASVQCVRFQNGTMTIPWERNMKDIHGFNAYTLCRLVKVRVAAVSPHFGLSSPEKAFGIIDSALDQVGNIFWLEDVFMSPTYKFRLGRMYMVAAIYSEDHMTFTVGWTF